MKWPQHLVIIRHAQSIFNEQRRKKDQDPDYQAFKREFERSPDSHRSKLCRELAEIIYKRYRLDVSDHATPLSAEGRRQARSLGARILPSGVPKPDVIIVSSMRRTEETLNEMRHGGFDPGNAKIVLGEERIREQEHGLSGLFGDWRVFQTFYPEQRELHDMLGFYHYQHPQGESVPMVRQRVGLFLNMLVREYPRLTVWCLSHHLTKLCIRASLERLTPEEFIELDQGKDKSQKPINCGVTIYRGEPTQGSNGRLVLAEYNTCLYK